MAVTSAPPAARARTRPAAADPFAGADGGLRSVGAALDALDCFAAAEELGVSDIARRLGVAKSTAHRLLTALCTRGLVEQNPVSRQYRMGLHLVELGQIAHSRMKLRQAVFPTLEELREVSGYTVHLSVADGVDVLQLERLESVRAIPLLALAPRRWPVHCTSSGKAIAAFDPELAAARTRAGLPRLTPSTVATAAGFERELGQVRRNGFATNIGEARDGAASVAAPVTDGSGRARAAISVVGPAAEFTHDLGRPARLVMIAARKVARHLAAA